MSRAYLDYTERRAPVAASAPGFSPDLPIAGLYRMKLVSGGVFVAVRIWFGPPLDPIDGTELDRSPRWQAHANSKPVALDRVWPRCAADPIDAQEYAYLLARKAWGEEHAPGSPQARPDQPINLLNAPFPI